MRLVDGPYLFASRAAAHGDEGDDDRRDDERGSDPAGQVVAGRQCRGALLPSAQQALAPRRGEGGQQLARAPAHLRRRIEMPEASPASALVAPTSRAS
jgi:hypothetical protein